MDVSKQVLGGVLVHMVNLLMSLVSAGSWAALDGGGRARANPCSFYLLNLGIDTTAGVVVLIYALRALQRLLALCPLPGFKTGVDSGYYGAPPRWAFWAKQAAVYFAGLMVMKFVVWLVFALFPWLGRVGDWLLAWTEGNRRLQVFFVMFVGAPARAPPPAAPLLTPPSSSRSS